MHKINLLALFVAISFCCFGQGNATHKVEVAISVFQPNIKYHFFTQQEVDFIKKYLNHAQPAGDFSLRYVWRKSNWQILGSVGFRFNEVSVSNTTYIDDFYGFVRPSAMGMPPRKIASFFGGVNFGAGYNPILLRKQQFNLRLLSQVFVGGFYIFHVSDNTIYNRDKGWVYPDPKKAQNDFYIESQLNIGLEMEFKKNGRPSHSLGLFTPFAIGFKPNSDVNPLVNVGYVGVSYGKYF